MTNEWIWMNVYECKHIVGRECFEVSASIHVCISACAVPFCFLLGYSQDKGVLPYQLRMSFGV